MKDNNNDFRFFVDDITLEKGKDKQGKDVMKVAGIASTKAKDSDDEEIDPRGYDVSYFLDQGFLNYNHQSKFNPKAVIGEPTTAKVTKEGLYVEGFLYPDSDLAKSVYETTEMLKKSSSKRRMGFSIEGKALERDPFNQNKITKARLTGLALTLNPKNPNTLVDIIKGKYHHDDFVYDYADVPDEVKDSLQKSEDCIVHIERDGKTVQIDKNLNIKITENKDINKSLSTLSGAAMIPESVDQDAKDKLKLPGMKKNLSKGEVYSGIFNYIYDVDLEKAEMIYEIVRQTAIKRILMETDKKVDNPVVTKEDLQKSLDIVLGVASGEAKENDDLEKSEEAEKAKAEKLEKLANLKSETEELEKSIEADNDLEKANKSDDADEDDEEDYDEKMEKAIDEDEEYQKMSKSMSDYKDKFKEKMEKGEMDGYPARPAVKDSTMISDKDALTVDPGKAGSVMNKGEEGETHIGSEVADLIKGLEDTMSGAIEKGLGETSTLIQELAKVTKAVFEKNNDLEKSINDVNSVNETLAQNNDDLKKSIEDTITEVKRIGDQPIPSKTVTSDNYRKHPTLEKGMDAGRVVLNQDNDAARAQIIEMMDKAADLGGANPNQEMITAMLNFESEGRGARLSKSIISSLEKAEDIQIMG
jgi:hypothetical protein